jgi:hypothetical protein
MVLGVLTEPLPYTTGDPSGTRLLAEIQALMVDLNHEVKRSNELAAEDVEIARRMALDLRTIRALLVEIRNALV